MIAFSILYVLALGLEPTGRPVKGPGHLGGHSHRLIAAVGGDFHAEQVVFQFQRTFAPLDAVREFVMREVNVSSIAPKIPAATSVRRTAGSRRRRFRLSAGISAIDPATSPAKRRAVADPTATAPRPLIDIGLRASKPAARYVCMRSLAWLQRAVSSSSASPLLST